jgi:hypothetical protein
MKPRDLIQHQMRDEALRRLYELRLPSDGQRDACSAFEQVSPQDLTILLQAALDAELEPARAVPRLAAIWSMTAAINLMDDIADGDCDYLLPAAAPNVVVLLQSLAIHLALDGAVERGALQAHARGIAMMAGGQCSEVRARSWTGETYLAIATQLGGDQYAAHLSLLWDGTPSAASAHAVGLEIGTVGMVAKDLRTSDFRLTSLADADRLQVVRSALVQLDSLEARKLGCGALMSTYARPVLQQR